MKKLYGSYTLLLLSALADRQNMYRELALVERWLSVTYDQIDVLLQEGMTGISVELEHASKNYHLINLGRDIELKTIPGDRVSC